jgi:hypothetical protein
LRSSVRALHDTHIPRILKVIQKFGRIHTPIVNVPALDASGTTASPTM